MYPDSIFLNMDLYSICFLLGALFALFFADFMSQRKGFSIALQRLVLLGGFLGVLLGYASAVLFQAFYNFLDTGVFQISRNTGATFFGGLIGGVVVFLFIWFVLGSFFCKDKKEPIRRFKDVLDIAAVAVPIAHGFGRIGCFFAGCCRGDETSVWYGVNMVIGKNSLGEKVYLKCVPVQLFEAIFLFLLGIALLVLLLTRKGEKRLPLMPFYAVFYGTWRFIIEFFRGDDENVGKTIVPFLRPSQLIAILLILVGVAYFIFWLASAILRKTQALDIAADKRAFRRHFGKNPTGRYAASGRINIIGEHIDYCGGKVLPAALGLKCYAYAAKNGLDEIRLIFKGGQEIIRLPIDDLPSCGQLPIGNYQAGVAYELQKMGITLVGTDVYYRCEVPFGGALSSSAAIEVSTALALLAMAEESLSLQEIALLCQRAEREFCGVNCGIMDQFISACGKKGNAVLLNCDDLSYEYVPIKLGKYTFLLANCNRPHSLKESKYNERREETELALQIAKQYKQIAALSQLSVKDVEELKEKLAPNLYARALHVAAENERVAAAVKAMQAGDMVTLGKALDDSHESLKTLYEVSCEETDTLQACFKAQKGCVGARMIGGGFGGCVLALVESSKADACAQSVYEKYKKQMGYPPTFYPVRIEDGVQQVKYGR